MIEQKINIKVISAHFQMYLSAYKRKSLSQLQKKVLDMEERLYKLYDDIDSVEEEIEEVETRIYNVRQQKISGDNIYQFLLYFDKLYDKFTDAEKKEFLNSFIERVDIYEQEQPDGRFLKHIKFRFPVYFNGKEIEEMSWDNETTVETVVLLSKGAKGPVDLCSARTEVERRLVDSRKVKVDFSLENMDLSEFKGKATYEQIKAYVLEKTGLRVSSLYIAQIKKKCGLDVGENFNLPKSENARQPQCTPEKEDAIMQAFRHFGII